MKFRMSFLGLCAVIALAGGGGAVVGYGLGHKSQLGVGAASAERVPKKEDASKKKDGSAKIYVLEPGGSSAGK
ncbi:MAG: hypothetical protein E6R08_01070 [Nevskiaceae bacterium]|nr:MAG: hypothetical protein E6R08_01070 [Nevskiaceae bacterium]